MFFVYIFQLRFSLLYLFWISIFLLYSNILEAYSFLGTDTSFFKVTSLLKIIIDEIITNKAPTKVLIEGTSSQIKYPKMIAKTKAKYLRGVTRETSENL